MRRLVIIGGQGFTVEAMDFVLQHVPGLSVFCVIDTSADLAGAIRECHPDIVVLDGVTEGSPAFESLPQIHAAAQGALVIVVIDNADAAQTAAAIDAGAFVCTWPGSAHRRARNRRREAEKTRAFALADDTATAPHRPAAALTGRELETLAWVAEGHTNASIARKLWVTEQTIKFHLSNIYRKLHVENRTEASRYAVQHGLVPHHPDETDRTPPHSDARLRPHRAHGPGSDRATEGTHMPDVPSIVRR